MLTPERCLERIGAIVHQYLDDLSEEDELVVALFVLSEVGRSFLSSNEQLSTSHIRSAPESTAGGTASPWLPYLKCLPPPSDFYLIASTWSDDELKLLGDAEMIDTAVKRREELRSWHDRTRSAIETEVSKAAAPIPSSSLAGSGASAASEHSASALEVATCLQRTLTPQSLAWAVHCVQSRAFIYGLDIDPLFMCDGIAINGMLPVALVPYADMFNHRAGSISVDGSSSGSNTAGAAAGSRSNASHNDDEEDGEDERPANQDVLDAEWVDDGASDTNASNSSTSKSMAAAPPVAQKPPERGYYVLRARRDYKAGEELLISYGDRSSRDLLETYGFIVPYGHNSDDAVSITLPSSLLKQPGASATSASSAPMYSLPSASPAILKLRARMIEECGGPTEIELCAGQMADLSILGAHPHIAVQPRSNGTGDADLQDQAPDAIELSKQWSFDGPSTDTLRVLRILCLSDADVFGAQLSPTASSTGTFSSNSSNSIPRTFYSPERYDKPISRDNELACLRLLDSMIWNTAVESFGVGGDSRSGAAPLPHSAAASGAAPGQNLGDRLAAGCDAAAVAQRAEALSRIIIAEQRHLALLSSSTNDAPLDGSAVDPLPWSGLLPSDQPSAAPAAARLAARVHQQRLQAASTHRINRARVLLLNLQHVCRLLQIADGIKQADVVTPGALLLVQAAINDGRSIATTSATQQTAAAPAPSASRPQFGLEVQQPWAELLLAGRKSIETRDYPLPPHLLDVPLAVVQSAVGGLATHGLASGHIVGTVAFSVCKEYTSRELWAADSAQHCVPADAPATAFGWDQDAFDAGKRKYWWGVSRVHAITPAAPVALTESDRVVRSIFRLPANPSHHHQQQLQESQLTSEQLTFADRTLTFWTRRRDAEVMSSKSDLTGVVSWPSTRLLAHFLASNPHLFSGGRVIELGCGTGLLSAVVAHPGPKASSSTANTASSAPSSSITGSDASFVLATDAESSALPLAQRNMTSALMKPGADSTTTAPPTASNAAPASSSAYTATSTAVLRWGNAEDIERILSAASSPTSRSGSRFDGQPAAGAPAPGVTSSCCTEGASDASLDQRFDLAVAGEVLYLHRGGEEGWGIQDQARALFATAKQLLKQRRCACSLAPPASAAATTNADAHAMDVDHEQRSVSPCGPAAAGVCLMVYSPRYHEMGPAVRAGAAEAGMHYRTVDPKAVMSAEMKASTLFNDTRFVMASACKGALLHVATTCVPRAAPHPSPQSPVTSSAASSLTAGRRGSGDVIDVDSSNPDDGTIATHCGSVTLPEGSEEDWYPGWND